MSIEMWLLSGLVTGVIGMAYFVYGKKQADLKFLGAGVGLMVYPYAVDSLSWTVVIGLILISAPFAANEVGLVMIRGVALGS